MRIRHLPTIIFIAFMVFSISSSADAYKDLNGNALDLGFSSLEQKKLKNTVLIFWASWCPHCIKEIPTLKTLYASHPEIQWLGVNVNKVPDDGLKTQQEYALPYPSIADPDLIISDFFDIRGTPGFVIINESGERIFKGRRMNKKFYTSLKQLSTKGSDG